MHEPGAVIAMTSHVGVNNGPVVTGTLSLSENLENLENRGLRVGSLSFSDRLFAKRRVAPCTASQVGYNEATTGELS